MCQRAGDFQRWRSGGVEAAIASFTDALGKNDYHTAASWYAEDGVIMPPNAGPVEGRAQIQKALENFGRVTAFSQPVVEVDGVGDLAYSRVNYDVTFIPANSSAPITDKGKVLLVLRKQSDGKWRTIRRMHSSNLPATG